jgi:hypothetical protein
MLNSNATLSVNTCHTIGKHKYAVAYTYKNGKLISSEVQCIVTWQTIGKYEFEIKSVYENGKLVSNGYTGVVRPKVETKK